MVMLLVLSGPSGVGKTTLVRRLRADPRVVYSVSATTRHPRDNERDGVDYHFIDDRTFDAEIDRGGFLEYAQVHGQRYGTLKAPLAAALAAGKLPLLDLDVQGAMAVRAAELPALLVFILPPSIEELERRLRSRSTDDEATIERRLRRAREELASAGQYDACIVNDDAEHALAELMALVAARTGIALDASIAKSTTRGILD
jgi:guanylate kinase